MDRFGLDLNTESWLACAPFFLQTVVNPESPRYNLVMQIEDNWGMLGHEWAVELLQGHLANQRMRHAYLITGPQGIGRRTLAVRVTQGLNCPQPISPGVACRTCHTCQRIERMQHPDLLIVQAEDVGGTLKVDQVRELLRGLSLAPYEAPFKVAFLLRFEEANPSAANALLKTLEEPPSQVILFVTARDTETLLPTIVSRCEVIRLRPVSIDEVSQGMQTMWGVPGDEAQLLAHLSNGRPGYAHWLHQNPEHRQQRSAWLEEHQQLLGAKRTERFQYAENLAKDRAEFMQVLQTWLSLWRDVMLKSSGAQTPITNLDCENQIDDLANRLSLDTAKQMVSHLEQTFSRLQRYTNPRLTAEVLLLNLPSFH